MADDDLDDDDKDDAGGGAEDGEEGGGAPKSGRKRLLIVIAAVLVLVLGGLAAAYFTGLLQPVLDMLGGGQDQAAAVEGEGGGPVVSGEATFYDLQEMLVNINTGGRKSVYLKMKVSLELANVNDIPKIEAMMPRIVDNFQIYLRELRVEDLKGSAGMYRLREELLKRVSVAVAPAKVNDVLFKEMLVQ
ncbi:MAG: flagellar basal body-associated FliL family protein [Alphaproteobacteria bacterium]|nr:flagellar basal body-associated FliL family protein [Alphaproteobacteria bacterium]